MSDHQDAQNKTTVRQGDEQYLSMHLRAIYEQGIMRKAMGDAAFLHTAAAILRQLDGYMENQHEQS